MQLCAKRRPLSWNRLADATTFLIAFWWVDFDSPQHNNNQRLEIMVAAKASFLSIFTKERRMWPHYRPSRSPNIISWGRRLSVKKNLVLIFHKYLTNNFDKIF